MLHLPVANLHLRELLPDVFRLDHQLVPVLDLLHHLLDILDIGVFLKQLLYHLLGCILLDHRLVAHVHHLPQ